MSNIISKIIYSAIPLSLMALTAPVQAQDSEKDIIVTGKTLGQTLAGLNKCLERNCAPNEDIDASLAHAENLFVAGEYKDASLTIRSAIKRNKHHAKAYPIDVSDLYRSSGRVFEHLGERKDARFAVLNMRDTLKKHLPNDEARLLAAEIEVANSRFKQGFFKEAKRKYRRIREDALKKNLPEIAGIAKIRELSLDMNRASTVRDIYFINKTRKSINAFINESANDDKFSLAAHILLARLDRKLGIETSTNTLIKKLIEANDTNRPILLSSEPINLNVAARARSLSNANTAITNFNSEILGTTNFSDRWADIGFWVDNNGQVQEAEVLRISGGNNWIKDVIASIESRIYAPKRDNETGVGLGQYVVERFTLTSNFAFITGSRIRGRDNSPIIRRLDLTVYDEVETNNAS